MKRCKQLTSLLLVCCLLLGMLPTTALASEEADNLPFSDVNTGDWFYDSIQYVYESGLMSGTGEDTFSPNATTTRGMIVTILHRMEETPLADGIDFDDVSSGAYYAEAVSWASANGIVEGYTERLFGPNDPITREQLAAILYRYIGYKGYNSNVTGSIDSFDDRESVSPYAVEPLCWAVGTGLISGISDDILSPTGSVTRAQVATILMRFCNGVIDKNDEEPEIGTPPTNIPFVPDTSEPGTYYTVSFESNGGSSVEAQTIKGGSIASEPDEPEKANCIFFGWYTGNGFSDPYDFASPVNGNITLYAKWYDETDAADSDNDGVPDCLEKEFGSDPYNADSDNDGISDYQELNWLGTNPQVADTNNDGMSDSSDDQDGDGLSNLEEQTLGTNPTHFDSDFDGLSDYDEVNVHGTNPLDNDTDKDGVSDGQEVLINSNPITYNSEFVSQEDVGPVESDRPVTVSAIVTTDAEGAGTLSIEEVTASDNILLSQGIAGYLGSAYNFTAQGNLTSATITFNYDESLGTIGDDFQPTIYYYDEETQLLEEVTNQTVSAGKVSATVEHFSTYILLNKVEFEKAWSSDIKPPIDEDENDPNAIIDIVFVIDYSHSMVDNDPNQIFKTLSVEFINKLRDGKDRAGIVKFIRNATVLSQLTTDKESLISAINDIEYNSGYGTYAGTNGSAGLKSALDLLGESQSKYKYIIFITDGADTYNTYSYESLISTANSNGVNIYTIGLGNAEEEILKQVADSTNGKYYYATAVSDSDMILDLETVFDEIGSETVDMTADTNNDGISDYYTELINNGDITFGTGIDFLVNCTDMFGEDTDDWDGDGLKNGEEVVIITMGSKVYMKMLSNPFLRDTDGDGYDDAQEVSQGTPPTKYTSTNYRALGYLENDSLYNYIYVANEEQISADDILVQMASLIHQDAGLSLSIAFDRQKQDAAKELLINYIYDYAEQSTIEKNKENIAQLETREQYLKIAQGITSIFKSANDIYNASNDLRNLMGNDPHANEYISSLTSYEVELSDANDSLISTRKEIYDAINADELSSGTAIKTILSDVQAVQTCVEKFDELFIDISSTLEDAVEFAESVASMCAKAIDTFEKAYDMYRFINLDTSFQTLSTGYAAFLENKGVKTAGTYIKAATTIIDGGLDIWETCNTYAKMKANRDAYLSVINMLYYISENARDSYNRAAALSIAETVQADTWDNYEQQLFEESFETVVLTGLKLVVDATPYLNVVSTIVSTTVSVTGLKNNAVQYLNCTTMEAVSDACISIVNDNLITDGQFFSYDAEIYSYLVQLAQSRLVGENYCKERMKKNDLAVLLSRWISSMGKDDVEDVFKVNAEFVYDNAEALGLVLSHKLPYYNDLFPVAGNGGGGGGGGSF